MDPLEQNNRDFTLATATMLVVTGLVILAGVILFPQAAFDDPSTTYLGLPVLLGTRAGSIIVFLLFGLLAANMAVFLSRVTRLEQVRSKLQINGAPAKQVSGPTNPPLAPPR